MNARRLAATLGLRAYGTIQQLRTLRTHTRAPLQLFFRTVAVVIAAVFAAVFIVVHASRVLQLQPFDSTVLDGHLSLRCVIGV